VTYCVAEGSELQFSASEVERLVAESPADQDVTLPVGALRSYREHVRMQLLGELDEAGRLLPVEPARRHACARAA
jgi:hypothetical protein